MFFTKPLSRRNFLTLAGAAGAGIMTAGCSSSDKAQDEAGTAVEFLDRQHGLLHRAVFILEEVRGGMDARMDLPPEIIQGTIDVIRRFVVDFHQKMEEKHIYPAFESAKKMGGLVGVLREQHEAGAQLVEVLKQLAAEFSARDLEKRRTMASAIHKLGRMYRAHADREDTVLFPVLRQVVTPKAYEQLNAEFRKAEIQAGGLHAYEDAVQKLSGYENLLSIGDLSAFTLRLEEKD